MVAVWILLVCLVASADGTVATVDGGFCEAAPDHAAPSAGTTHALVVSPQHCDAVINSSSGSCEASVIGDDVPVLCVGTFDVSAAAPPARLLYMRDASPSWLWVAAKYVSADSVRAAPEASPGHAPSFNYHLNQPALQHVAAAAADIFMREDESRVAAVMSSDSAFQAVRRNILAGAPWFKDTHGDGGLLGDWMLPLRPHDHVPDARQHMASDACSYSACPASVDWEPLPCQLWTRVFMSCYNSNASHSDLRANWRLRGNDFFTSARAHSMWFKLPATLLVHTVWIDSRAAMRQGYVDSVRGAAALRLAQSLHHDVLRQLRGKRMVMLGDSNMRFQYLDLAYFVCFGEWPGLSEDQERMQWLWRVSYLWDHDHAYSATWHESFMRTTAAFRGLQQCDCFRPSKKNRNWKSMSFESRVTRCNGITLEYHQHFGPPLPISGRLPLHAAAFAADDAGKLKLEAVCNGSSSSNSEACLGDGRVLWGGDIMDCVPPGVTMFDVLPPCDAPWSMLLPEFLRELGSSGGGVDVLLLNYGAHSGVEGNASYVLDVLAAGAAAVASRNGTALWKTSYIVNPAWYEDRDLALPARVADAYVAELQRMRGGADAATARRWRVLDGEALTCLLTRSGFADKFHVKNWVTGHINAALLRMLTACPTQ